MLRIPRGKQEKTPLLAKKSTFFAWPQRLHQHGLVLASFFAPVTSVLLVLVKHWRTKGGEGGFVQKLLNSEGGVKPDY